MISFSINGKTPLECSEDDLLLIIGNPDYRESGFVDYKTAFSALNDKVENEVKEKYKADFRNDVCSFANTNGGYLIYGVKEKEGIPTAIDGISIDNTDQFERHIKDLLSRILPRMPSYSIRFIQLINEKYVVVLCVKHDDLYPYVHLVDGNYRVFRRVGNSNAPVQYNEMKMMFTQSLSLEKEIERFRRERINYFYSQVGDEDGKYSRFIILHIIPETFMDNNYNQPLFVLVKKGHRFGPIFASFQCNHEALPTVEGLRYPDLNNGESECRLNNNGIAEFFYSAESIVDDRGGRFPNGFFPNGFVWTKIKESSLEYFKRFHSLFPCDRFFVCFSVVGCKGVSTELDCGGKIDRNQLLMNPVVFEDVDDSGKVGHGLDRMKLEFFMSLGSNNNAEIKTLIEKVYPSIKVEDGDNI